jgi:hypothetical protein
MLFKLCWLLLAWQSSEFVWDFGVILGSDKGLSRGPEEYFEKDAFDPADYQGIQKGDLVWVKSRYIKAFTKQVLPQTKYPFILIISDGDESFPSNSGLGKSLFKLIEHKNIIHIFAQNCDYEGPSQKVSPLPIGVDFHTEGYKAKRASPAEQEAELKQLLTELKPTYLRKKRAFVDFQHNDSMKGSFHRDQQFGESRTTIFEQLKKTGLIDSGEKMARADLWKKKGEYAFSISPHGNGLDCHRTWEDLILGLIVIVKTSPLDPLYEGLPVVIVNHWDEVTEENLEKWLEQYRDAFTNPSYRSKLTNAYWLDQIYKKRQGQ